MRKIPALAVYVVCAVMALTFNVYAADTASPERYSLTLHYYYEADEEQPISDAAFCLYLAAELDEQSGYTITNDFDDYKVDLSHLNWGEAGRLTSLASTLSAYVSRDGAEPLRSGITDAKGQLTFEDLVPGLYLVTGDQTTASPDGETEWVFTPQPILLPIPYPSGAGIEGHHMDIEVKYECTPPPTDDDLVNISVAKVWKGSEESPDSVTAQLLLDGTVSDEVVLNADNDWQYTWEDLSADGVWQVVEKEVPEGYTVSIDRDGFDFTITNTYDTQDEPSDDPSDLPPAIPPGDHTGGILGGGAAGGSNTSDDQTGYPEGDDPGASLTDPSDTITDDPTNIVSDDPTDVLPADPTHIPTDMDEPTAASALPQTGQLWWPVPVMLCVGILLIWAGNAFFRKERSSHE